MHPGRCAQISLGGKKIGFVGELHPRWRQKWELAQAPVLFELDFPGHYRRRLRLVAVSVPSVVGPYTGVNCTLSLTNHGIRMDERVAGGYGNPLAPTDDRFFKSPGMPVGKSLVEDDKLDEARSIIAHAKARGVVLQLPVDHIVAAALDANAATEVLKVGDPAIGDRMGLDIGPETARLYAGLLADAKTVVWNGPMGVFEVAPFAQGTLALAHAAAKVQGTTIIGGGDSVAAINAAHVADKMTHISTGGGASLEFLGGAELPGVAALPDKK